MWYLFALFLIAGCTHDGKTTSYSSLSHQAIRKPAVVVLPMEDCTEELISSKTATTLTHSIINRLQQKNLLSLSSLRLPAKQFLVTMQLIQHQEAVLNSSELTISIHLKILDIRSDKPQIVLEEVINHNTILETALNNSESINWTDPSFHLSPIGLAYAKLSREIATRIEDYIRLATKG